MVCDEFRDPAEEEEGRVAEEREEERRKGVGWE